MDVYEEDDFKFVDEEDEVNRIPENETVMISKVDEEEKGSMNNINLNENYECILPNQENTKQEIKEDLDNLQNIKGNLVFDFSSQNFDKNLTVNEQYEIDNNDNIMKDSHPLEQIFNLTEDNNNNLVNKSEICKEEIKLEYPIEKIVDQAFDEFKINQEEKKEKNYQPAKDIKSHDIIKIQKEDEISENLTQKQLVHEGQTYKENILNHSELEFNEINEDNHSEKQREEIIELPELEDKNLYFMHSEENKVEALGIIEETKIQNENSQNNFSQNLIINNNDVLYEEENHEDNKNHNDLENLKYSENNQNIFTNVDEICYHKEKLLDEIKIENNHIDEEKIEKAVDSKIRNDPLVNNKKEDHENLHAEKNYNEFNNFNITQRIEESNSLNAPELLKEDYFEFNEIKEEYSSPQAETECFKDINFELKV
jgi:hypothetical protein